MEESGEHDMLIGEYHHNIDEKNRLVIPSKFRADIGKKFILTRGLDKCLFIYSSNEWETIVAKLKKLPFTHKDSRYFTRFFLSGAIECELDNAGRVCITSPLIEYADITKETVIIGSIDHLEIWSEDLWNKFFNDNLENFSDIAENLFKAGE